MRVFGKIVVTTGLLLLAPGGAALAACGIGSTIWEGNNSTGAKILAFTTNVWTFKAISTTFEIAGCTEADNLFKRGSETARNEMIYHFASQNLDHLAVDMARGHGEHLDVLVRLIDLREPDAVEFRSLAQENFETLFSHDHTTSGEMLSALVRLMRETPLLSDYVES